MWFSRLCIIMFITAFYNPLTTFAMDFSSDPLTPYQWKGAWSWRVRVTLMMFIPQCEQEATLMLQVETESPSRQASGSRRHHWDPATYLAIWWHHPIKVEWFNLNAWDDHRHSTGHFRMLWSLGALWAVKLVEGLTPWVAGQWQVGEQPRE